MDTSTPPITTDAPSEKRGSRPADLHAYRRGHRMSRDEPQPSDTMTNLRASIRNIDEQKLARALGWFSVALGVAEVVAPRQVGRAIGVNGNSNLLRAMGLREIASGVGLLAAQPRAGWMWSRVAGDAMDLALLGAAMTSEDNDKARVVAATAAVAGVAALDIYCSQQLSKNGADASLSSREYDDATREPVHEMVTVNASPEACYRMWRDLPRFPRFMQHVESVTDKGDDEYHWVVKAPGGGTLEWDSRITADEPGRRLAWETLPGAEVQNRGSVTFEPAAAGRGTIVQVEMSYVPPAGALGAIVAKVAGNSPVRQVREDLRRFKEIIEAGELPTTEGQSTGRRSKVSRLFTKAQRR